eukprot:scaffold44520_cov19-Tisochrysis_lutea.AAC.1
MLSQCAVRIRQCAVTPYCPQVVSTDAMDEYADWPTRNEDFRFDPPDPSDVTWHRQDSGFCLYARTLPLHPQSPSTLSQEKRRCAYVTRMLAHTRVRAKKCVSRMEMQRINADRFPMPPCCLWEQS